ncbi:MAG: hypothetical protein JSS32_07730 [Verrucomicrobia bacterium]|nr:hypothetical protein [Verrucomicrobiota bacterium]
MGRKAVVLGVIAVVLFFWLIKAPIMASYLTKKLGVDVSIGSISMWPSQTKMNNFRIRNPHGFKSKSAFKVESTQIQYAFKKLWAEPTEIDLIDLENIFLSVEFKDSMGTSNNWTAIGERMPNTSTSHEVLIHKLVVRNLTIEIRGLGLLGASTKKTVPYLEFYEINSKEGFPTKELIRQIFGGAGIQQYIQNMFNPQKIIEKYLPFKLGSENDTPEESSGVSEEATY